MDERVIPEINKAIPLLNAITNLSSQAREVQGFTPETINEAAESVASAIHSLIPDATSVKARAAIHLANIAFHSLAIIDNHLEGSTLGRVIMILESLRNLIVRDHPDFIGDREGQEEWAIVQNLIPSDPGHYVDIGAWKPIEQSNTWHLYERGWRGVLIEPVPFAWCALLTRRPGDHLIPFAVANNDGISRFWMNGPIGGLRPDGQPPESIPGLVQTRKLSTIINWFPSIKANCGFMSVDVEGCELEVLSSNDWNTFRPKVLCIEWLDKTKAPDWLPLLIEAGYRSVGETTKNLILQC